MFALKKTILLLWSLALLAMPLATFAEEVREAVEKVDINTADAETLADKLYGIGPVKAEAIIKFREENGPFKAVIELIQVRGIGEGTLEKNKDILTVSVPQEQETSTENQTTESTLEVEKQVTQEVETESTSKEEKSSKQTQNAPDKETSTEGNTDNKAEPATDDEKTETTSSPSAK
jgi:competence protein ComEA